MTSARSARTVPTGWSALDAVLRRSDELCSHLGSGLDGPGEDKGAGPSDEMGLVRGALHEWFGVSPAMEAPAGRSTEGGGWSPPLFLLTHLARQAVLEALDRGAPEHVVWIGRNAWPYPRTLTHPVGVELASEPGHGAQLEVSIALSEPEACTEDATEPDLLTRSLFVATDSTRGAQARANERLWAIDTALRCPGVTVVVADGSGLPMAATRRLQLAAASNGALVLLARPPEEVREISAATTRWMVTREAVPDVDAGRAGPSWRLVLIRAKGAQKVIHREVMGRRRNQPSTHSLSKIPFCWLFDVPGASANADARRA